MSQSIPVLSSNTSPSFLSKFQKSIGEIAYAATSALFSAVESTAEPVVTLVSTVYHALPSASDYPSSSKRSSFSPKVLALSTLYILGRLQGASAAAGNFSTFAGRPSGEVPLCDNGHGYRLDNCDEFYFAHNESDWQPFYPRGRVLLSKPIVYCGSTPANSYFSFDIMTKLAWNSYTEIGNSSSPICDEKFLINYAVTSGNSYSSDLADINMQFTMTSFPINDCQIFKKSLLNNQQACQNDINEYRASTIKIILMATLIPFGSIAGLIIYSCYRERIKEFCEEYKKSEERRIEAENSGEFFVEEPKWDEMKYPEILEDNAANGYYGSLA